MTYDLKKLHDSVIVCGAPNLVSKDPTPFIKLLERELEALRDDALKDQQFMARGRYGD